MDKDQYSKLVAERGIVPVTAKDVEAIILSPAFIAVYQLLVLELEQKQMGLAMSAVYSPESQFAFAQRQGQIMGVQMALDRFIELSVPSEETEE